MSVCFIFAHGKTAIEILSPSFCACQSCNVCVGVCVVCAHALVCVCVTLDSDKRAFACMCMFSARPHAMYVCANFHVYVCMCV